jgi:hypothetical protein
VPIPGARRAGRMTLIARKLHSTSRAPLALFPHGLTPCPKAPVWP